MQENKNEAPNPPQVPGSDHRDTSGAEMHSSKLRNKLEKLAQWRIDPALIEFPANTLEFRGGFATVSQGLLAPRPSTEEGANGCPEHTTDEHPSRDTGNSRSESDLRNLGDDQQGKDVGADGRTANDDPDLMGGEGRKDNDVEHEPDNQASVSKIGYDLVSPEHKIDEEPDSGDGGANIQLDISSREDELNPNRPPKSVRNSD